MRLVERQGEKTTVRQIIGGTFRHIMQPLSWIQMVIMSRQSVIKNKK